MCKAKWSNCKWTQSRKLRFFLCKKHDLLLQSLHTNNIATNKGVLFPSSSVKHPNALSSILEADYHQKVVMTFSVKSATTDELLTPHQVMVYCPTHPLAHVPPPHAPLPQPVQGWKWTRESPIQLKIHLIYSSHQWITYLSLKACLVSL